MINFKNMMLTIRNEYHEHKNQYGKITMTNHKLNEIIQDNYWTGYKKGAIDLKNEIEYAQSLLEQNNELIKEVEELQDSCNEALIEVERWKSIVKTIVPEMIDEE
ncbi:hypothetical protein [Turicibacter sanguinis]|jgi:hypothetical protein|uniref:hypothetical protein n=1 Tax=Turicibacter sanguinis TaxID=154288 RepID=UPI00325B459F